MKILSVTIENINSLKGKFEIPFYPANSLDDNLCLIFGPTGSGKTTIFDAICLALYGKTPRLKSTGNEDSISPVITMGCKDGRCELLFEANDNNVYRAVWKQKYGKLKNGDGLGALTTEQELFDYTNGSCLATGKYNVFDTTVERLTGMKYDAFVRIAMLAQGEFNAFLTGDNKDRASILEKLTDTGIYRQISRVIYKLAKAEVDSNKELLDTIGKLDARLKSESNGLNFEKRSERLGAIDAQIAEFEQRKLDNDKAIAILGKQEALLKRASALKERLADVKREEQAVNLADAALLCKAHEDYSRYCDVRGKLDECITRKDALEVNAVQDAEMSRNCNKILIAARDELCRKQSALTALNELLVIVRQLDMEITGLKKSALEREQELADAGKQLEACEGRRKINKETSQKCALQLNELLEWKQKHAIFREVPKIQGQCQVLVDRYSIDMKAHNSALSSEKDCIEKINSANESWEKQKHIVAEVELAANNARKALEESIMRLNELRGDCEIEKLRQNENAAFERLNELNRLLDNFNLHAKNLKSFHDNQSKLIALKAELCRLKERHSLAEEERKVAEDFCARKTESYNEARTILSKNLVKLRAELKDGEPCPLCGSRVHNLEELECLKDNALREYEIQKAAAEHAVNDTRTKEYEIATLKDAKSGECELQQVVLKQIEEELDKEAGRLEAETRACGYSTVPRQDVILADIEKLTALKKQLSEMVSSIDKQGRDVAEKQKVYDEKRKSAESERKACDSLEKILQEKIAELEQCRSEIEAVGKRMAEVAESIVIIARPLSIKLDFREENWHIVLLSSLNEFSEEWNGNENAIRSCCEKKQAADAAFMALETQLPSLEKAVKDADGRCKEVLENLAVKTEKRKELFKDKIPEMELKKAESIVRIAEDVVNDAEAKNDEANALAHKSAALFMENSSKIKEYSEALSVLKEVAMKCLADRGFRDEDEFSSALLVGDVLREKRKSVMEFAQECKTLGSDCVRLLQERRELVCFKDWQNLTKDDLEKSNEGILDLLGELREKHKKLLEQEGIIKDLERSLTEARWKQENSFPDLPLLIDLNERFGSESGDRLASRAQEYTLEQLLVRANVYMKCIMPRYTLKRASIKEFMRNNAYANVGEKNNDKAELAIGLIDHYHQNEMRMSDTASGGEKFIISLALALGLSDLNSDKLKIQSLFLDEGFGTLDESILAEVIDMLQNLRNINHQHNRKIFIISHVKQLKEVIPEQILLNIVGEHQSNVSFDN